MPHVTDHTEELVKLTLELQHVRQKSLSASRTDDFRTVARLTGEAARLNREILRAEGVRIPVLDTAQDKFFTSNGDEMESEPSSLVELVHAA